MDKKTYPKEIFFKLAMIWLGIVLVGAFWLTARSVCQPVSMTIMPEAPRKGQPIIVTFKLNNPYPSTLVTGYRFFANGNLVKEGQTTISPLSSKTYQYLYPSPVEIGERVSFTVKTASNRGNHEKVVSAPSFPPQVCSSFISFASFSTTVMNSMATTAYFKENFTTNSGLNTGLVISIILILLLIFMELAGAATENKSGSPGTAKGMMLLQRYRVKFGTLTWILLVIFICIVYTKVVMILSMT